MNHGLIQVDGKFYKKVQLVMLSSDIKTSIAYLKGAIENLGLTTSDVETFKVPSGTQKHLFPDYQNLYFVSNDPIGKYDWVIDENENVRRVYDITENGRLILGGVNQLTVLSSTCKKIIASTEKTLCLPEPSSNFIDKFISEYCKENIIEHVLLEYIEIDDDYDAWTPDGIETFTVKILKVSNDNNITVKPFIETWNDILARFNKETYHVTKSLSSWLEENYKVPTKL